MIDLYTWTTSNGDRAAIMLEECGLPYRVHKVDLARGEQRSAEFLKINPAGAIPTIVDPHGPGGTTLTLAQSGAIALYPVCAVRKSIVDAAGDLPHVERWMGALAARPGVARGMKAAA